MICFIKLGRLSFSGILSNPPSMFLDVPKMFSCCCGWCPDWGWAVAFPSSGPTSQNGKPGNIHHINIDVRQL